MKSKQQIVTCNNTCHIPFNTREIAKKKGNTIPIQFFKLIKKLYRNYSLST